MISSAEAPAVAHAYENNFRISQIKVIGTLYLAYLCYYLPRKADSVVKPMLHTEEGFAIDQLAMCDTVFLITYTCAVLGSGVIGNYIPSNRLLFLGLVGMTFVSLVKARVSDPVSFAICQFFHALCQSTGWPTCIKVLASWITGDRGFIMGIWTTCQSVGGVLGAFAATYFMSNYAWRYAYYYSAPILISCAFLCLTVITDEPPVKLKAANSVTDHDIEKQDASSPPGSPPIHKKVTISQVIVLPGVMLIGVSYFFLKFLRYALLYWLPYYYEEGLHYSVATSGYISTSFELGGMIGTPLIGYISDKYFNGKRDSASAFFLMAAVFMLCLCMYIAEMGTVLNSLTMILIGITVIGPDSVLSGMIAQDIGSSSNLGKNAVGTIAGVINSIGSCGAIFQSYAISYISKNYGWDTLFLVFIMVTAISASILVRVAKLDIVALFSFHIKQNPKIFMVVAMSCFVLLLYTFGGAGASTGDITTDAMSVNTNNE